ncbi:MAG: allantoate amidohydrolase [Candidatus Levyibacteriota bacterium]
MRFGAELMRQADVVASFTDDPPRITRGYLTAQHRQAGNYLIALMREAGMSAAFDALGNVVGHHASDDPRAPTVMIGSHQDTVRNAGKYDGVFGILAAIACVRDLHRRGRRLPFTIEVVAFGDEEGLRFGATMSGSRAMAGSFDPGCLDLQDEEGTTMRDALRSFGGDPDGWRSLDRRGRDLAAYVEVHIEQGPVLLNEDLPLGVVSAIAGTTRLRAAVRGLAGHAGTVPMGRRRDACTAACEMVLAVERHCQTHPDLVGTVGRMSVAPGAINVIPQDVEFTVDLRSPIDAARHEAARAIAALFAGIARRRGVSVATTEFFAAPAARCDPALMAALGAAIAEHGIPVREIPSGAGHDAMVFAPVCPMAMLFVRCGHGGISHHPAETMTAEDAEAATSVLLHFLERFDPARAGA